MVPQRHTRETRRPGPAAGSVDDGSGRERLRAYDRIVLGMDPGPGAVQGMTVAQLTPPRPAPRASGLFGLLWC